MGKKHIFHIIFIAGESDLKKMNNVFKKASVEMMLQKGDSTFAFNYPKPEPTRTID